VAGAEGVVDVDVGEAGQRGREAGIVLSLARFEATVLEHQHVRRAQRVRHRLDLRADHCRGLRYRRTQQLLEAVGDRPHRESGVRSLGAPQMRHEHQPAVAVAQEFDGRQGRADTGIVPDHPRPARSILERHVEVDPHQHASAVDRQVADGLLGEGGASGARDAR
jgi:hypothetical protein